MQISNLKIWKMMKMLEKYKLFNQLKVLNLKYGEEIMEAIDVAEKFKDE